MENKLERIRTTCYHTSMYRGECNITHGGSKTRLYRIWKQMRIRCNCKTNPTYRFYGARGIKICKAWGDFDVFREWAYSSGYNDSLSIERKDVNVGYNPENCTWIERIKQIKNTRNIKSYTYEGTTLCHNDWARQIGISPSTLTGRIKIHGIEGALSMSKRRSGQHG